MLMIKIEILLSLCERDCLQFYPAVEVEVAAGGIEA